MRKNKRFLSGLMVTVLLLITAFHLNEVKAGSPNQSFYASVKKSEEVKKVSLSMVGDVLLHTSVEKTSKDSKGRYFFLPIFTEVKKLIQSYDLAIVNQETILGGEELGITGYPMFNAPTELGDAISDTGFDVILHANNHALDRGEKGIINTLKFWRKNYPDLAILGMYDNKADSKKIFIKNVNGIKIAILNYTYGTNGLTPPVNMPYAVDYLQLKKVSSDIKKARKAADFVIVCPHWGTEYSHGISSYQKYWTKIFLTHKVDLVLGAHPHVIEPIEWLKDKKTGHEMLVYYSLGNFMNGTGDKRAIGNRYLGGMAKVTIEKKGTEAAKIKEFGVKALVNHREDRNFGSKIYSFSEYSEALAKKHVIKSQHNKFSMKYARNLFHQVWGKYWD